MKANYKILVSRNCVGYTLVCTIALVATVLNGSRQPGLCNRVGCPTTSHVGDLIG